MATSTPVNPTDSSDKIVVGVLILLLSFAFLFTTPTVVEEVKDKAVGYFDQRSEVVATKVDGE